MTLSRSPCKVYGLDCTKYINMLLKDDNQMFVHKVNTMLSRCSQWWAVYVFAGMWALVLFSELPNRI